MSIIPSMESITEEMDRFYDKSLDEYKSICINNRGYLPTQIGNKVKFATLLASQEDIENKLLQSYKKLKHVENNLEQNKKNLEDKSSDDYSQYESVQRRYELTRKITKDILKNCKGKLDTLEAYKNVDYMNYKYKATESETKKIIGEFIDRNGRYSMYEFYFYIPNYCFTIENLRAGYVWLDRKVSNEPQYNGWTPTYLCLNLENREKNREESKFGYSCKSSFGDFDIQLCDSHIVYDNDCIVVITEEYDLILEVKERREEPKKDNPFLLSSWMEDFEDDAPF